MAFLTHRDIEKRQAELFDDGFFNRARVRSTSYDLTLGPEYFVSPGPIPLRLSVQNDIVTIPHGEFALLQTDEKIRVPNDLMGLITMRFSLKAKGLINVSGFHVDPGFKGRIIYSVYNAGPTDIQLRYKEPTFTIFFSTLAGPVEEKSLYGNEKCPAHYQNIDHLPIDTIATLRGSSVSLTTVERRVGSLENQVKIYSGIIVALLLAIIGWIVVLFQGH